MRNYTVSLANLSNGKSLVLWVRSDGHKEFVVCTDYDCSKPVGSQWCWGHYFWNLFDAVDYISEQGYAKEESNV